MSSLTAKVGKSHSTTTRRGKVASPKTKKHAAGKKKKAALKKIVVRRPGSRKAAGRREAKHPVAKKASAKRTAKPAPRKLSAQRKPAYKAAKVVQRTKLGPAAMPVKRVPPPEVAAAVRAFEHALKVFNRHDFSAAKLAFESILQRYGDQTEVVVGARTYMAVCEQRLARAPSVPRNAEGLYDRGVLEYNKGNARDAIELFERALKSEPRADHIMYSLAAAHARVGAVPKTLDYLRRAIGIRPVHRSHARRDPDFTSLHSNEDFQQLVGLGLELQE
jgi:tetratricopeptide (TPR) repeat protein